MQDGKLVAVLLSTKYKYNERAKNYYLTQLPIFCTIPHSDPLSSPASSINVVRTPDTAGQSTNDYYATVRSCSTRPTTPDLTAFHRSSSSSSGGGGGRRATSGRDVATRCRGSSARRPSGRPRQNVTLVMAYNWTGKISTLRRLVCLRSRIGPRCNRQHAAAAEFLSRLQRQRRTAKDGKKESQTCCGRKTTPLRQTDGRTDGQAGGQL